MTTIQILIVCLTVLAVAGIAAWLGRELVTDATSTSLVLAQKERDADQRRLEYETAAAALQREATGPGPELVGRTLVVHTRKPDDQSVRGVVHAHHADRLSLRDAVYLHSTGEQAAGGIVTVPLTGVSSWQEITPTTEVSA